MKIVTTTPSGVRLYYQDAPRRLYTVNGKWVPSVTTVLGVLDKPALVWWAMKVGVEGVLLLRAMEKLPQGYDPDIEEVVAMMKEAGLTTNQIKDRAGDRGNDAHEALEVFATRGVIPDPSDYSEAHRGYVEGLRAFLVDAEPTVLQSEVMVGSAEYGYAGRYDLLAQLDEREVVTRLYPKRKPKRETLEAGVYLLDLKTTKGVYSTHHLQLAAYEGANRECGYGDSDVRGVIRVSPTGGYELIRSDKPYYDAFLAVNECWKAMEAIK